MSCRLTMRNTRRRWRSRAWTVLVVVFPLASCAGRTVVPVDAASRDGSVLEGSTHDAMPSLDGGYACPAPHFGAMQCDHAGDACPRWAERVGAGWVDPMSGCFTAGTEQGYCVRASTCTGPLASAVCQCGSGPPCEVYQVCARRAAGAPYECLSCTAN